MDRQFLDDAPKTDPWSDDDLGFSPFAEGLARAVLRLDAPNGFVIGLHGAWGSGKSTALNFVRAHVQAMAAKPDAEAPPLQVVSYEPWIISGHQDLTAGFFKVLSEALDQKGEADKRTRRGWLKGLRQIADPTIRAAGKIGATLDPTAGVLSNTGATVVASSVSAAIDRWLQEPSLQSSHDALRKQLAAQDRRFLVIIDDLDRLTRKEIRAIMQMVKSVGRLPKVIYLLAYDRAIVWAALDGSNPRGLGEPNFAEKIVQQELELPTPSRSALLSMLDRETGFLIGPTQPGPRWQMIVGAGIHRWIRYPRDVARLANGVTFAWAALDGEIDAQDLLAIEAMRLFDPYLFAWIRRSRDFLMSEGRWQMILDDERKAYAARLRESLPEETRKDQIDVLCTLFPTRAELLHGDNRWGSSEPYHSVMRRRGLASPAGYDGYFALHPSPNAIPKVLLDEVGSKLGDESFQVKILGDMLERADSRGRALIADYLDELNYRFYGSDPLQPTQALLDALFVHGEHILSLDSDSDLFSSPRTRLHLLISKMLEAWGPGPAGTALLSAFDRSGATALASEIWCDEGRLLGLLPSDRRDGSPHIASDAFVALGPVLLRQIRAAHASGTLDEAPMYFNIARAWSMLENPEAARAWLLHGIQTSARFLAKFSRGFLGYSIGEAKRVYSYSPQPDEQLISESELLEAARRHAGARGLDADETARLDALLRGLEGRINGDSDEES